MVSVTRLFVAALGLLAFSGAAFASQVTPDDRVKTRVIIRHDPSTDSAPIGRLLVGETLELSRELSGWYEVRLPDGTLGYVSKVWTNSTEERLPEAAFSSNGGFKVHVIDIGTGLSSSKAKTSPCSMTAGAKMIWPREKTTGFWPTSNPSAQP